MHGTVDILLIVGVFMHVLLSNKVFHSKENILVLITVTNRYEWRYSVLGL